MVRNHPDHHPYPYDPSAGKNKVRIEFDKKRLIQISITRPDARAQAKIRTGLYFKIAKDQVL